LKCNDKIQKYNVYLFKKVVINGTQMGTRTWDLDTELSTEVERENIWRKLDYGHRKQLMDWFLGCQENGRFTF
jgi:hypothetical protein